MKGRKLSAELIRRGGGLIFLGYFNNIPNNKVMFATVTEHDVPLFGVAPSMAYWILSLKTWAFSLTVLMRYFCEMNTNMVPFLSNMPKLMSLSSFPLITFRWGTLALISYKYEIILFSWNIGKLEKEKNLSCSKKSYKKQVARSFQVWESCGLH